MNMNELRALIDFCKNNRQIISADLNAFNQSLAQDISPSLRITFDIAVASRRASLIVIDNYIALYESRAIAAYDAAHAAIGVTATVATVHGFDKCIPLSEAQEASTNKTNETKVVDKIAYKPYLH